MFAKVRPFPANTCRSIVKRSMGHMARSTGRSSLSEGMATVPGPRAPQALAESGLAIQGTGPLGPWYAGIIEYVGQIRAPGAKGRFRDNRRYNILRLQRIATLPNMTLPNA